MANLDTGTFGVRLTDDNSVETTFSASDFAFVYWSGLDRLEIWIRGKKNYDPLYASSLDGITIDGETVNATKLDLMADIYTVGSGGGGGSITSVNGDTGPAVVLNGSEINSTHTSANYTETSPDIDGHIAGLDAAIGNIPAALTPKGVWDADTNTPALASGVGTIGDYYRVSVAGTTNLDGISDWQIGDHLFFAENSTWNKVDNTEDLSTLVAKADFTQADTVLLGTGPGTYVELKHNYSATAAPTATDDSAAGYAVGSEWIDTTGDKTYKCVDATATAAVWVQANNELATTTSDGLMPQGMFGQLTKQDVTYAATISPDFTEGNVVRVISMSGNMTIDDTNFNAVDGEKYAFAFRADGTDREVTFPASTFKQANGTVDIGTITVPADERQIYEFRLIDSIFVQTNPSDSASTSSIIDWVSTKDGKIVNQYGTTLVSHGLSSDVLASFNTDKTEYLIMDRATPNSWELYSYPDWTLINSGTSPGGQAGPRAAVYDPTGERWLFVGINQVREFFPATNSGTLIGIASILGGQPPTGATLIGNNLYSFSGGDIGVTDITAIGAWTVLNSTGLDDRGMDISPDGINLWLQTPTDIQEYNIAENTFSLISNHAAGTTQGFSSLSISSTDGGELNIIDASTTAQTVALGTSTATATKGEVQFYTNGDMTNGATFTVGSGQTLNGVVDDTFNAGAYAKDTQFRVDSVVGGFVVSIVGASSETTPFFYHFEGAFDQVDPTNADHDYEAFDLTTAISSTGVNSYYVDTANEVDNNSVRSGNTITLPAGTYDIEYIIGRPSYQIPGGGASTVNDHGEIWAAMRIGGSELHFGNGSQDAGGNGSNSILKRKFQFDAVTTIDLGFSANADQGAGDNEDFAIFFTVREWRVPTETVLAGMVEPTSLKNLQVQLSADVATVSDSGQNLVPWETPTINDGYVFSGGKVTLEANKRYKLTSRIAINSREGSVFYDFTNSLVISSGDLEGTGGASVWRSLLHLIITPTTNIEVGVVIGNPATIEGGNATTNYGSHFLVEQLPISTIVMPDALTPISLSYLFNNLTSWTVTSTFVDSFAGTPTTIGSKLAVVDSNTWTMQEGIYEITFSGGDVDNSSSEHGTRLYNKTKAANITSNIYLKDNADGGQKVWSMVYEVSAADSGDQFGLLSEQSGGDNYPFTFSIKELPTSSVVAYDPGQVEATALSDMVITLTEPQTTVPGDLGINSDISTGSNITRSGNEITLKGGYRYELFASVYSQSGTAGDECQWEDTTTPGTTLPGTSKSWSPDVDDLSNATSQPIAGGIVSPSSDITVKLVSVQGDGSILAAYCAIWIKQLPTLEVVTPGDVPVEDVEVTLYSSGATLLSTGSTQTIPFNWNQLTAQGYDKVRFEAWEAGTNAKLQSTTVSAEALGDGSDGQVNLYDNTAEFMWFENINAASNSFTTLINGADSYKVRVVGIKGQKTVVSSNDLTVDDQTASGYNDFGTLRIQRGTDTSGGSGIRTITLPQPMGDANYHVDTQFLFPTADNAARTIYIESRSTTSFDISTGTDSGSGSSLDIMWRVEGLKP